MAQKACKAIGLSNSPILLMLGFIIITAVINLFVGGLTSKWMLLGPIFIPMLYHVNPSMTPDVVAAAYPRGGFLYKHHTLTPLMTYAGVILDYMRKYKPDFTLGNLIGTMLFRIQWYFSWCGRCC